MTGRRNGNQIRGPQSALTDFLASNNISAAQIRRDYEQRRTSNLQTAATPTADTAEGEDDAQEEAASEVEEEVIASTSTKRKRSTIEVAERATKAKKAKKEEGKKLSKKKKGKRGDSGSDDDFEGSGEDEEFVRDIYKKARPAPGQLSNCAECSKRFTVTPYSRDGPEGGLLCTPCGKLAAKDKKAQDKTAAKPVMRRKRKVESDKLDGLKSRGAKSLQQLCIEKVVQNHHEVEELGELPQSILEQLSAIFSKRRVLKPHTLPLFLRPDLKEVVLHDSAYLEVDDYKQIFAIIPHVTKLSLGNACQFKDAVVEYMIERCRSIKYLQLYAPNLVTNEMWSRLFQELGATLETVKLQWLDAAFEDENVAEIIQHCPRLNRLKLKTCRRLTENALVAITSAKALQHLSLQLTPAVSNAVLLDMLVAVGRELRTLSLEKFQDADDGILEAIHDTCVHLSKLRFSVNDTTTNAAWTSLFTDWANPPLSFIDVNCTRDVDNNNPDGPEDAVGIASTAFIAMMEHSGSMLKHLDIASCRHVELSAFLDVFNGVKTYPALEFLNISFCNRVDTTVMAGIFKSCPALKKLVAFGCFDVGEIVVPRDLAVIGLPKASDSIEQLGTGLGVEEALGRMIEAAA